MNNSTSASYTQFFNRLLLWGRGTFLTISASWRAVVSFLTTSASWMAVVSFLFAQIFLIGSVVGQTVIYSTNFGTGTTLPTGWTVSGAQAANISVTTAPSVSTGYTTPISASGGSHLSEGTASKAAGTSIVTLAGQINSTGYSGIEVIYGAFATIAITSETVVFEWSSDGTTWNSISYTDIARDGVWRVINGGNWITLPSGAANQANLRFRFTFIRTSNANNEYNIDDFTVRGTTCTTPTLAGASQSSAVCAGTGATINMTGLVANSTGNAIDYTVNGIAQTQITGVSANASGAASFTTPALTAANNGQTLQITKITNGICNTTFARNVTLSVNGLPTASAGGSQTICSNGTATVSGASSSNGAILWTHNGAGTISNATTLTPTYTAASGDGGNTVTLTLTVSNAPCTAATATYSVVVKAIPTASAGGSQTICSNGTATVSGASSSNGTILWTHNGAGTITSGATTLTPTYTPAAGDAGNTVTLTMTVSNSPCTAATATYSVVVKSLPSFTACPTNISTNTTVSTCSAVVNYTATAAGSPTLTLSYTLSGATTGSGSGNGTGSTFNKGVTTVTITASNGCAPDAVCSFTVTVNDTEKPTITAPSPITTPVNTTSCSAIIQSLGTPVVGDNCTTPVATWSAVGAIPSSGNVSSTNIKFPKGTTTVVWTATDVGGNTKTATQIVTVTTTLAATAVNLSTTTVCTGGTANLSFTITGGQSSYTVVYNDGTNHSVPSYTSGLDIIVTPSATTTYTLVSVTDAYGCIITPSGLSATINVDIPRANIPNGNGGTPNGKTICYNAPFPYIVINFNGNSTYTFVYAINGIDQPAVTFTGNKYNIQPAVGGVFSLVSVKSEVTGCMGVVSNDQITILDGRITITQQPTSQVVCIGSSFTLSITATSSTAMTYQWRKNGNPIPGAAAKNSFYTVSSATAADFANYDVVITNTACGSITSNTVTVSNCSVKLDIIANMEGALGGGSHAAFMPVPSGLTRADLTTYQIVDYVTVEIRKSGIPGGNTMIQSQQAMIKTNGHIVGLDGVSPLIFTGIAAGSYNIAVLHRFHLPIRTTTGVSMSASGVTAIDLTTAGNVIGAKLVGVKYVMYAGDVNASGRISATDISAINAQNGTLVNIANYLTTYDINFTGRVSAIDISLCNANNGVSSVNLNQ